MIPIQALVGLFQAKKTGTETAARLVVLGIVLAGGGIGFYELRNSQTASSNPAQQAFVSTEASKPSPPLPATQAAPPPIQESAATPENPSTSTDTVPAPKPDPIVNASSPTANGIGSVDPAGGNRGISTQTAPQLSPPPNLEATHGWKEYSRQSFTMSFPGDWEVTTLDAANSVIIAPRGQVSDDNVICGVRIGSFFVKGNHAGWGTLEEATRTLIEQIRVANPGKQWNGSSDILTVGGLDGRSSVLTGPSKIGGIGTMWILTTQRSTYSPLWYVLFTAPEADYTRYQQDFRAMANSVRVKLDQF